jgi:thiol:disulfide interchange protein
MKRLADMILLNRAFSGTALALLLAVALAAPAFGEALPAKFDPTRDAAADVALAVAQAKAEGKRVLVDVGGEWCSWCHVMDRFFAADADARALRERGFVFVKVNWSPQNHNEALLSRWPKINGYPHLFVLGPDGALLHSQDTSKLEAGRGYDRDRFMAFLRAWSP